jgi:hypothetical protein
MFNENPEQRAARQKSATMDSVNLLKVGKLAFMNDEYWADTVRRNQEHIELMIEKGVITKEETL